MSINIISPNEITGYNLPKIFLAGGITNCPDWQKTAMEILRPLNWIVYNPRRITFNVNNPSISEEQITWEDKHLRDADQILFYFPSETLCPIVLFELGKYLMSNKPLWICCHPNYERKFDVEFQTHLVRPKQVIYEDISVMCRDIVERHKS